MPLYVALFAFVLLVDDAENLVLFLASDADAFKRFARSAVGADWAVIHAGKGLVGRCTPARISGRCVARCCGLSSLYLLCADFVGGIEKLGIEAEVPVAFLTGADVGKRRNSEAALLMHEQGLRCIRCHR